MRIKTRLHAPAPTLPGHNSRQRACPSSHPEALGSGGGGLGGGLTIVGALVLALLALLGGHLAGELVQCPLRGAQLLPQLLHLLCRPLGLLAGGGCLRLSRIGDGGGVAQDGGSSALYNVQPPSLP